MNRGIFEDRRGMRPIQAQSALLEGYQLRFNLALGPGERGVANLEARVDARTWGVLYLITTEQSEHLDRTEGVLGGIHISVRQDQHWAQALSALHRLDDRGWCSARPAVRLSPIPAKFRVGRG
jgi:hypothetical protein